MTKVNSWNEWDPLKHVIVGRIDSRMVGAPEAGMVLDLPEVGIGTVDPVLLLKPPHEPRVFFDVNALKVVPTCVVADHITQSPRAQFVFGDLALPPAGMEPGTPLVSGQSWGNVFAFQVLPTIIFFSSFYIQGSSTTTQPLQTPFQRPFQLYDLEADIAESNNLIAEHSNIAKRLEQELEVTRLTLKDARIQYLNGQSSYLNYLAAWSAIEKLERQLVSERAALQKERITLHRVMGWQAPEDKKMTPEKNSQVKIDLK